MADHTLVPSSHTATRIEVPLNLPVGGYLIVVETMYGTALHPLTVQHPTPVIAGWDTQPSPGQQVTALGTWMEHITAVRFDGKPVTIVSQMTGAIVFAVPAGVTGGTTYTVEFDYSRGTLTEPLTVQHPTPVVTGGTLTSDATYYYRTFTANGTLAVSGASLVADTLVVAGGGGAAIDLGGGGGAGGYRSFGSQTLAPGSFAVVIGAGGAAASQSPLIAQTNGNATSIGATSASGGGRGAGSTAGHGNGSSGGSGGGGYDEYSAATGGSGNAGGYSPVEGYAGGGNYYFEEGRNRFIGVGGGGGGAGGVGASSTNDDPVAISGGAGATWLNGTTYAVGGAGGMSTGANGTANRGNGGNAKAGYASTVAGAGGSGIVVVRYTRAQVGG